MKVGDLVRFKRPIFKNEGQFALIETITRTQLGLGQIHLFCSDLPNATIPWHRRKEFIEVISESR